MVSQASKARYICLGWKVICSLIGMGLWTNLKADERPFISIDAKDLIWLNNASFGATSKDLEKYRMLGRENYLSEQLKNQSNMPSILKTELDNYEVRKISEQDRQRDYWELTKKIKKLKAGSELSEAKSEVEAKAKKYSAEASQVNIINAIYSPGQLNELMTWFWLNHFSVYGNKGSSINWFLNDYSDVIRKNALGKFDNLVLATLKHPVMLRYLDNDKNERGKLNENYARELLELHTLGVDGGYNQQDVQELAKILTGVGVNFGGDRPKLGPEEIKYYIQERGFEFNPEKHETGKKIILGKTISDNGFKEIEDAVEFITSKDSCAKFISSKIALYFMGAEASPQLLSKMSDAFKESHGEISQVLRILLLSDEFIETAHANLKDPQRFVISSIRLMTDSNLMIDPKKPINWLRELNQGLFLRVTPDGYPIDSNAWSGAGQLASRLSVARTLGQAKFLKDEKERGSGIAIRQSKFYKEAVEPYQSKQTKNTVAKARMPTEENMLVLASPEFNMR